MTVALPAETSEARERARQIRSGLDVVWPLLIEAYRLRDWEALGYDSWTSYCREEFGRPVQLTSEERREVVPVMRSAGMSTRAIGTALGVSKSLVATDLAGVSRSGQVTGLDGKTYQPRADDPIEDPAAHLSPYQVEEAHNALWLKAVRLHIERIDNLPPSLGMAEKVYRRRRNITRLLLAAYEEWLNRNGLSAE